MSDLPWQVGVVSLIDGFMSAPHMILGGLAGWFAGAGSNSYGLGLAFVLLFPATLAIMLHVWLSPYGSLSQTIDGMKTDPIVLVSGIVGATFAMLVLFVPFVRARKAWRSHKALLETVK